ncbi:hypothetical protein JCM19235_3478 [Vibrio maritimus]|uniref:Uncharacterized protein n=1 Tax=Vibrio maritimus TaxID=990268 RepID=A0A090RYY3_9VIBR|nr:hypothetical protein JCM19235_3478 [Vibrio maritimus]
MKKNYLKSLLASSIVLAMTGSAFAANSTTINTPAPVSVLASSMTEMLQKWCLMETLKHVGPPMVSVSR